MNHKSGSRDAGRLRYGSEGLPGLMRHYCERVAPCGHAAAARAAQVVVELLADFERGLVGVVVCANASDLARAVVELACSNRFGEALFPELRS